MKKSLLFKKIFVLITAIFTLWQIGNGQELLLENFNYPAGALLTANGWTAHSGSGTQPIDVIVPGLSFTGYPSGNIGGAAQLDNTGEDVNRTFTEIAYEPVYVAFLFKVNALTDGYFLHLGQTVTGSTHIAKVFTKTSGTNFLIGITKLSESTPTYSTTEFTVGTTYLAVLKYNIIDGPTNDEVSLYVFDSSIPAEEPVTATIPAFTNTLSDYPIGSVALRQYSASQRIIVDGIRVGTFWLEAISDIYPPVATFNPVDLAFHIPLNVNPTIAFDEAVRKTDGTELVNADLAALVTFKKTNASGVDVPFTATIDAGKRVITVTPAAALDYYQAYYLTIGPLEDASGNEVSFTGVTFTTVAVNEPKVTLTAPVGGEVLYAGDQETITWTSANVANVTIQAWLKSSPTSWGWSTLAGPIPAALGTLDVTVPPQAMYGTEYKIRIYDASDETVSSTSGNFTIIGVATSIYDLRNRFLENDIVYLDFESTVTFLRPANRNQKYIQDNNAGLLIDDPSGVLTTVVAVGDNITELEGRLGYYGGMLQIVPTVTTVTVVSSGNIVYIPGMTIDDYIYDFYYYESMLIHLQNVYFTTADGSATFAASTNYTLTDGIYNITFRTFYAGDGNIVGTVIPVGHLDLTGIAGFYTSGTTTTIQVFSRTTDDFKLLSSEKAITSFAFNALTPAVTGTIDQGAKTIALIVPNGTNVTALVPTIGISAKATVSPASGIAVNFTTPATYTVTAEDGTNANYTVTVSFATGVDDVKGSGIKIYPVPAGSELVVTNIHSVKLIEILDATGKVLKTINAIETDELRIPVSNLNSGMYFIRFTTENDKLIKRFIKK